MKMDVICIYCKARIQVAPPVIPGVSYGVCQTCTSRLVKDLGQSLSEYLDELSIPIMVVQEDLRVVAGNQAVRKLSPEPVDRLCGRLCGEVIGCTHSKEPKGCGRTVYCPDCTIRSSVVYTIETGEPCIQVPACHNIGEWTDERRVCFQISTLKMGAFAKLIINSIEGSPEGRRVGAGSGMNN